MRFIKLSALLLIAIMQNSFAQNPLADYKISGVITDSTTQKNLEYVTLNLKNGSSIKSQISKSDGSFVFAGLATGKYLLSIAAVGYKPKDIVVDFNERSEKTMNMGNVKIAASNSYLKEVSIRSDKPIVKREIDRISYDLQADPDSKGTNLLTIMRKIPFLSVDGDENVLFKGKQDFKVLINGRQSSMFERNLKEVLRTIPSSTIQRIEVITNPPAKYDAEGFAGIINIITVPTKIIDGYNGTININQRFPVGGPGAGASFSIKSGKLGASFIGGGSLNRNPETINSNRRSATDGTLLLQNGTKKSTGHNGYLGTDISYEINSQNLVSTQININGSSTKSDLTQNSLLNNQISTIEGYRINNNGTAQGHGWDVALNYQLGFKANKNKLLTFSYQYNYYQNELDNQQMFSNRENYSLPNYKQLNMGSTAEHTFQTDYVQLVKKVLIEAGVKAIIRDNKSNFSYSENDANNNYIIDPTRSNIFDNQQNIFGAYNSYQFSLKKWEFKTGFRAEQTMVNPGSATSNNYFNIIPSVSISHKINKVNTFSMGFSQRIKRPGINKLNPFVDRTNPNAESSGNPNLRPSVINGIQLGYSAVKKYTLNLSVDYSFAKNVFLPVSSFDPATKITKSTYENVGKASGLNLNVYLNYPITTLWNISLNGNGGNNWLSGINGSSDVDISIFVYSASVATNYALGKGWRANASVNAISQNITSLQGKSNALTTSSFGINKNLLKNKLSLSATVTNPFTKYRNNIVETTGPNFVQLNLNRDYFRTYNISLNYSFGKLKDAVKKTKRGIKNDDLSN